MKKVTRISLFITVMMMSFAVYANCTVSKTYTYYDVYGDVHTIRATATRTSCTQAEAAADKAAKDYIKNHLL